MIQKSAPEHATTPAQAPGVALDTLSWPQAEAVLTPTTVAVVPLGAATKEHGPHLPLNTDWLQVEHLKRCVMAAAPVVVLPTIAYSHYPAFTDYPGSVSLDAATARDTVLGIARSLARHGVRRVYVINYGISTNGPLQAAAQTLAEEGVLLRFTDLTQAGPVKAALQRQQGDGTHADVVETSVMLHIAPEVVDMSLAVRDQHPDRGPGGLTRDPQGSGVYSPSGIYGDPTGANAALGAQLVDELLQAILRDIATLQSALPPAPTETPDSVLRFWFGRPLDADTDSAAVSAQQSPLWWKKDPATDAAIRTRFAAWTTRAASGALDGWARTPEGRLALIVLTDQFPRNMYRNTPQAFAFDTLARRWCLQGLQRGDDQALPPIARVFFYLPLEHAETEADQAHAVALYQALARAVPPADTAQFLGTLDFAQRHQAIVARFGRFPHRNAILGRTSTPEELAFLAQPGSSF